MSSEPYLSLWEFAEREFPRWVAAVRAWSNLTALTLKEADRRRARWEVLNRPLPPSNPLELHVEMQAALTRRAEMLQFRTWAIMKYWLPAKIRERLRSSGYEVSGKLRESGSRVLLGPADLAALSVDLYNQHLIGSAAVYGEVAIRKRAPADFDRAFPAELIDAEAAAAAPSVDGEGEAEAPAALPMTAEAVRVAQFKEVQRLKERGELPPSMRKMGVHLAAFAKDIKGNTAKHGTNPETLRTSEYYIRMFKDAGGGVKS